MHPYLVGLTGGIGSGKSVAADRFSAEHGIVVVDADVASRAVVAPGEPALAAIAEHFGPEVLASDGTLDRAALRQIVFADTKQRHWLQGLLHPLISAWLKNRIDAATSPYVLLVNPLLLESGQQGWCDRVLLIDAPEEMQMTRTMARDANSRKQVENIMRAQASREQRRALADDIITNDKDLATLHARIDCQHEEYLKLCQSQPA